MPIVLELTNDMRMHSFRNVQLQTNLNKIKYYENILIV